MEVSDEGFDKSSPGMWYAMQEHSSLGDSRWAVYCGNKCLFVAADTPSTRESEFNAKFIADIHNRCWEYKMRSSGNPKSMNWIDGFFSLQSMVIELIDKYLLRDQISRGLSQNAVQILVNLRDDVRQIAPSDYPEF